MKNDYSKNYFWKIKNPKTQKYKFYLRPKENLWKLMKMYLKSATTAIKN